MRSVRSPLAPIITSPNSKTASRRIARVCVCVCVVGVVREPLPPSLPPPQAETSKLSKRNKGAASFYLTPQKIRGRRNVWKEAFKTKNRCRCRSADYGRFPRGQIGGTGKASELSPIWRYPGGPDQAAAGARSQSKCRRAYRSGIWRRFGESGQASLNACGVWPVHRRKDRWNAAGSEYWRKNAMSPIFRLRS